MCVVTECCLDRPSETVERGATGACAVYIRWISVGFERRFAYRTSVTVSRTVSCVYGSTLLKYPYYLERYGYNTSIGTILVLYLDVQKLKWPR